MPALFSLVAPALIAASVLTSALALPSRRDSSRPGAFSLEQVRNPGYVRSGPLELARAYRKFGASVPADLTAAVARIAEARARTRTKTRARTRTRTRTRTGKKRSTGSATTTPESDDVEYLTPVSIGTPAQTLNVDIDTGSSDFWVFSSETPKSQVDGQTAYAPNSSSTSQEMDGYTWKISYGDGSSSSGNVYTDVVTLGGLTVEGQAVECAQQVSSSFTSDSNNDGLIGLAFSPLNQVSPEPQKTIFDSAKASLDAPVFTADLKAGKAGKYNFGYIDSSAYTGSVSYAAVNDSRGFWMFTTAGYGVSASSSSSSSSGNTFSTTQIEGIADTGTTLMLLPDSVVTAYYDQLSGSRYDSNQGGYVFGCSTTAPDFVIGLGSANITVPGKYINYAPIDSSGTTCFGGIQSDSGIGFAIWGDVALKAAFVVFDAGNTQIGFAPKTL